MRVIHLSSNSKNRNMTRQALHAFVGYYPIRHLHPRRRCGKICHRTSSSQISLLLQPPSLSQSVAAEHVLAQDDMPAIIEMG